MRDQIEICGKWTMDLPDTGPLGQRWFLDWVLQSPSVLGKHLTASWAAYQSLAATGLPVETAHEFFGGLGAHGLMIDELWKPRQHTVGEISAEAVDHLRTVGLDAYLLDAYADGFPHCDLMAMDFGDLTARWLLGGERQRKLLDAVFAEAPPTFVTITDIAGPYLHLQKGVYEKIMGEGSAKDYPTYLRSMGLLLEDTYGYRVESVHYHRGSAVFALSKRQPDSFEVRPVPDTPKGLSFGEAWR